MSAGVGELGVPVTATLGRTGMPWEGLKGQESFLSLPLQGPSCASGISFSGRTLYHPSFWPLYQAASCRGLRPSLAGHQREEQVPRGAGTALVPLRLHREPVQSLPPQSLLLPRVPGDVL